MRNVNAQFFLFLSVGVFAREYGCVFECRLQTDQLMDRQEKVGGQADTLSLEAAVKTDRDKEKKIQNSAALQVSSFKNKKFFALTSSCFGKKNPRQP